MRCAADALHRRRGAPSICRDATRAVVFAARRGRALSARAAGQGVLVPLVVTHAKRAEIWFTSVAQHARWHGLKVATPADPRPGCRTGALRGRFCSRSTIDSCWTRRSWPVATACTARCCPSIADVLRSTGPCCGARDRRHLARHGNRPTRAASLMRRRADPRRRHGDRGVPQSHRGR
jgi:hypothetical protein